MEFRQERAAFVRSYAINQFNKDFPIHNQTKETEEKMLENVKCVNDVYRPNRYYKRKNAPPPDIQSRVQITLLEYGHRAKSEIALLNDKEGKKEEEEILHNQAEEVFYIFEYYAFNVFYDFVCCIVCMLCDFSAKLISFLTT